MNGSKIASRIDSEYRRKKFYEERKKDNKRIEKMVEDFIGEMENEYRERNIERN